MASFTVRGGLLIQGTSCSRAQHLFEINDENITGCLSFQSWDDLCRLAISCSHLHLLVRELRSKLAVEWKQDIIDLSEGEQWTPDEEEDDMDRERETVESCFNDGVKGLKVKTQGRPSLALVFLSAKYHNSQRRSRKAPDFAKIASSLVNHNIIGPECPVIVVLPSDPFGDSEPAVVASNSAGSTSAFGGNLEEEKGNERGAVVAIISTGVTRATITPFWKTTSGSTVCERQPQPTIQDLALIEGGVLIFANGNQGDIDKALRAFGDALEPAPPAGPAGPPVEGSPAGRRRRGQGRGRGRPGRRGGATGCAGLPVAGGLVRAALVRGGAVLADTSEGRRGRGYLAVGLGGGLRLAPTVLKGFRPVGPPAALRATRMRGEDDPRDLPQRVTLLAGLRQISPEGQPIDNEVTFVDFMHNHADEMQDEAEIYLAHAASLRDFQDETQTAVIPVYQSSNHGLTQEMINEGSIGQFYGRNQAQCLKDAEKYFQRLAAAKGNVQVLGAVGSICCGRGEEIFLNQQEGTDLKMLCVEEGKAFESQFPGAGYIGYMCNGELGPGQLLNGGALDFVGDREVAEAAAARAEEEGDLSIYEPRIHGFTNCLSVITWDQSSC